MRCRAPGWALASVLALQLAGAGTVWAHALPGSVVTFSQDGGRVELSVRLPLEELAAAAPAFEAMREAPIDTDLPDDQVDRLAGYFSAHLGLRAGDTEVPLTIERATLRSARNEHVGRYVLLSLALTADVATTANAAPLTLTYDAVMHEVRNHRATVFREMSDGHLVELADFGYRPADGGRRPVSVSRP